MNTNWLIAFVLKCSKTVNQNTYKQYQSTVNSKSICIFKSTIFLYTMYLSRGKGCCSKWFLQFSPQSRCVIKFVCISYITIQPATFFIIIFFKHVKGFSIFNYIFLGMFFVLLYPTCRGTN